MKNQSEQTLRDRHSDDDLKKILKTQNRRSERNQQKAIDFEQAMFERRSRYLILVLTLGYIEEYRSGITLDQMRRDRDALLNNARFNQLLQAIKGYVWKIEEGHNANEHGWHPSGLHMHVVIFYDGSLRADVHYAKLIGDYWESVVTHGRGAYWNSNANKSRFAHLPYGNAMGQIDRNDSGKREALKTYMTRYLAKTDQQVSSRGNLHTRMFGTSRLPE